MLRQEISTEDCYIVGAGYDKDQAHQDTTVDDDVEWGGSEDAKLVH